MTQARTPGFTAEKSLGILFQEYRLARTVSDGIGIITAQAHKPEHGAIMLPQNRYCCSKDDLGEICGCVCPRDGTCGPCTGHDCSCSCE